MAGSCLTAIKLIGVSSLGLLTASLSYQTLQSIPQLIRELSGAKYTTSSYDSLNSYLTEVKELIIQSRVSNGSLAGLAGALLAAAYKYSPSSEKHPYLLYAALGAPLTVVGIYYNAYSYEKSLLSRNYGAPASAVTPAASASASASASATAASVASVGTPSVAQSNNSDSEHDDNESLSKSYIHVDEESSENTTPLSTVTNSPKIEPESDPLAASAIDQEVEVALAKKSLVRDLENAQSAYFVGTAVAGASFLIGVVGFFGDYFFL